MKLVVVALAAAAAVAGCTTQPQGAQTPSSKPAPSHSAVASFAAVPATTFEQLRSRPIRTPASTSTRCPVSRGATIEFPGGTTSLANGTPPFYFGPWDGLRQSAGDGNKTPWRVEAGYTGQLLVRGRRIDGPGSVAFGFWPKGFGTPAEAPGVPIVFKRVDTEGRTIVYQPELDIDAPAGGRANGHYWSYPSAGCYMIQADGDTFTDVTVISVD